MDALHTKELTKYATASQTPLGGIVRAALGDPDLKLSVALRKGLKDAGYTVDEENHKEGRYRFTVTKDDELIAWGASGTQELAIEYAMLGAMREGK